jgi:hypothetical protein
MEGEGEEEERELIGFFCWAEDGSWIYSSYKVL